MRPSPAWTRPRSPRAIRAARRADPISTLEATVQVLAMVEGLGFEGEPLLEAFGRFVTDVAQRQRPAGLRSMPP